MTDRVIPFQIIDSHVPKSNTKIAWTARPSVHWIVPTIGITIFTLGIFVVIQCIFLYLPLTYP